MPKGRKPKNTGRYGQFNSKIEDHKRIKSKLIPPLANIPNLSPSSWYHERMPEVLWAVLIRKFFSRREALGIFYKVANFLYHQTKNGDDLNGFVTHSSLSIESEDFIRNFLTNIVDTPNLKLALRPLLLFENLPAFKYWAEVIDEQPQAEDWYVLAEAVGDVIDHQSQSATDCRFLKVACLIATGNVTMPPEIIDKAIANYHNLSEEEMRFARPTVRAMEISFASDERDKFYSKTNWNKKFWEECLAKTQCSPLLDKPQPTQIKIGTTLEKVNITYNVLSTHYANNITTTEPNPKVESIFGIALYSIAMIKELLNPSSVGSIGSQLVLRALTEALITLSFLVKENNTDLWTAYRVYGAGQAKLQYLKLDDLEDPPDYINGEFLKQLANEDQWEEFLEINVGKWENRSLRDMAMEVGLKEIYDRFYGWTSSFIHAQWGSVRDVVFTVCSNPLHRLHRIPRHSPRQQGDVLLDAVKIADKILEFVDTVYPSFAQRLETNLQT